MVSQSSYISIVLKLNSELLNMGKGYGSGEGWGQGEGNGNKGHHGHKITKNKWNHGVCSSCGNCSVCKLVDKSELLFFNQYNRKRYQFLRLKIFFSGCMTFWCPCVSMCLLADKAGLTGFQHKYMSFLDCLVLGGSGGFFTLLSACLTRERIRDKYNIPGDGCEDCVCTYCCLPCVICQMHNQVDGK